MIKFENTKVAGLESAVRGMRHPLLSYKKADSTWNNEEYKLGPNDLDFCKRLIRGGSEHRKFLRQIQVWVDITAPFYWWKQADTYKVGTTTNSCSTMHKLTAKPFELSDFSTDGITSAGEYQLVQTICFLNETRLDYLEEKDADTKKALWLDMVNNLPESYNQKRTINMNYETILTMCRQREGHKLSEWEDFRWWAKDLPYMEEFMECLS